MENIMKNKSNLKLNNIEKPLISGTVPLGIVNPGKNAFIRTIKGRDDAKRFLNSLGFVEGAKVEVVSAQDGNLIIKVKGSRIALSRSMANRVYAQIA